MVGVGVGVGLAVGVGVARGGGRGGRGRRGAAAVKAEEERVAVRRADGVQEVRAGGAALVGAGARVDRRAVAHPGDAVEAHLVVAVHLQAGVAGQRRRAGRGLRDPPHVGPLVAGLGAVERGDGVVRGAVPDGHPRPRAGVAGVRATDQVTPGRRGLVHTRAHAAERVDHAGGAAVRDARDDRSTGEDVRVGGEHDRAHRSARGEAADVDAGAVHSEVRLGVVDHLLDRQRLALTPGGVAGLEEVEAGVGVVAGGLLGDDQGELPLVGVLLPAGVGEVAGRVLGAAVQQHHGRGVGRQVVRPVGVHGEVARVGAEAGDLGQGRGLGGCGEGDHAGGGEDEPGDRTDQPGEGGRGAAHGGLLEGGL